MDNGNSVQKLRGVEEARLKAEISSLRMKLARALGGREQASLHQQEPALVANSCETFAGEQRNKEALDATTVLASILQHLGASHEPQASFKSKGIKHPRASWERARLLHH